MNTEESVGNFMRPDATWSLVETTLNLQIHEIEVKDKNVGKEEEKEVRREGKKESWQELKEKIAKIVCVAISICSTVWNAALLKVYGVKRSKLQWF